MIDGPRTLYPALKRIAERNSGSTALVFGDERITYSDFIVHIDATAEHLHQLGLRRGEAVAVFSQNCPELLYCFVAAAKLGAIFVPLNFNLTTSEAEYIFAHSEAKLVFHDGHVADISSLALPEGVRRPISELSAVSNGMSADVASGIAPSDDLLIAYTSGTTATPKAVVHDQESQIRLAESLARFWDLSSEDTTVVGCPFGFLLGLSTTAMASLLVGARVVVRRRFHPGEILEDLVAYRASIYNGVPTMFQMMLEFAEQQGRTFDLSHARALISSGAPMPDELRRRFLATFNNELQNYFGMTEAFPLFGRYASDRAEAPAGAAGRIAPGAEIRVVDESAKDCAPGAHGELLVRAAVTFKRYHKNPDLTASTLVNGSVRTGDLGYLDAAGYVFLTGRAKDIIKRGGANVAPAEVEAALLQHPAVQSVAVVGVSDRIYGEVPIAYVVNRTNSDVSSEELMRFATGRLAKFKVPAEILFVDELPLGKTGKVDKNRLKGDWERLQGGQQSPPAQARRSAEGS